MSIVQQMVFFFCINYQNLSNTHTSDVLVCVQLVRKTKSPIMKKVRGVIRKIRLPYLQLKKNNQVQQLVFFFGASKTKILVICSSLIYVQLICETNVSYPGNNMRSHPYKRITLITILCKKCKKSSTASIFRQN